MDDPDFFLAPEGKTDPEAELKATIAELFQPDQQAAQKSICRFYARYQWLKKMLPLDPAVWPDFTCPEIDNIEPRYASLIFPTYYMNNPASMFGHTLLAINTDYDSKRLGYAVNYAARVDDANGLSFAISGVFGLYQGFYSVDPYYKKIQEYSDIHQRDIWEYRLNLTPEEIKRLIWHVQEFQDIHTDYFFFDENCSYNLLYLLEAARPSLDLVSRFDGLAVLPADTIRAIRAEGLITAVDFRPSKATKIRYKIDALDDSAIQTALDLIKGRGTPADLMEAPLDKETRIRILDLVSDQLQYLYAKNEIDRSEYRQQFLPTLRARSQLGQADFSYQDDITPPTDPMSGHDSRRISFGGGVHGGDPFTEIRYRPAFTDLVDMDYLDNQGAQIEFGDARIRYYPETDVWKLQQLDIIDIVSISGRNAFFKPLSWKFDTGFHRKFMRNGKESLYYRLNTGTGVAVDSPWWGLSYAMIQGEADIGGALEKNYAAGAGMNAGVIKSLASFWQSHFFAEAMWFAAGDDHDTYTLGTANNFRLSQNTHFSLELSWDKTRRWERTDLQGQFHLFF
ncbi:MAG: DUF4105 domain-containing protein [Desulfosudaceae bacterium]